MRKNWVLILVKVAVFLTIAIVGFGEAVYHLWNWLMPTLFHLPVITFWQSVGLLALSWVLFGGWRGFGGRSGYAGRWRQRMEQMSPEERAKFREAMLARCGQRSATATEGKG
jgi:hypothetical protein